MRRASVILALLSPGLLALGPPALSAQTPEAPSAEPERLAGPAVSLDLGARGLARLGVWTPVGDRLSLGLEVDVDYLSWTHFPDGDPARASSGTDWRAAAGPAARFRLASTGDVSLHAYGSATWGAHRFATGGFDAPLGGQWHTAPTGWGVRQGVALDWRVSERWAVGAIYANQWLSGTTGVDALPELWLSPRLGFTLRFGF